MFRSCSLSLYIYICVRVYVHMLWLCLKTIEIYTVTLNLNWLKHSIPNKMLDFQIPDVPSGKSESDPALNLGSHENYSHIDGFIDGFWLVVDLPLWKIWVKVSWDEYSQYMESHKIHVPKHQPGLLLVNLGEHPRNQKNLGQKSSSTSWGFSDFRDVTHMP